MTKFVWQTKNKPISDTITAKRSTICGISLRGYNVLVYRVFLEISTAYISCCFTSI